VKHFRAAARRQAGARRARLRLWHRLSARACIFYATLVGQEDGGFRWQANTFSFTRIGRGPDDTLAAAARRRVRRAVLNRHLLSPRRRLAFA